MEPGRDTAGDIARIEALLERRFGVIRGSFAQRVRKAGSKVPRELRPALARIRDAAHLTGHPKLLRTIDARVWARDVTQVVQGLEKLDLADQRKGFWLGLAGGMAFNLLLFGAFFVWVLWYFGLLAG